ncbi:MAG: Asp23/Gls24 family envelope stress response protein [Intestinibacillus sp.]
MAESNYWSTTGDQGTIKISDDVVASIAALAAAESEGVSGLYSSLTSDIASFLGKKNLSKGVKVEFEGNTVAIEIGFLATYGCNIRDVAQNVQKTVKSSIESMTGLSVSSVNVHVGGVTFAPPAQEEPEPATGAPAEAETEE